jgi:hypothetical protein
MNSEPNFLLLKIHLNYRLSSMVIVEEAVAKMLTKLRSLFT